MINIAVLLSILMLDPPFTDHAVLQRDKPVLVRGIADAGVAVSVSFAGISACKVLGGQKGDYASYKKFLFGQISELIDSYNPGNIRFDDEWERAKCENEKRGW